MARRTADSDDERTLRDSVDILQEEEDQEQLLTGPRSTFRDVFARADPNAPRQMTRKEIRREKRRERRMRKRRKGVDNGELLYEMEEGKDFGSSRSSSSSRTSSEELTRIHEKYSPRKRRRGRLLRWVLLPLISIGLFALLIWGATKASSSHKTISPLAKQPARLVSNGTSKFAPTTILISLDGFRADFLNRGLTPTLNNLIAEGVSPEYMLPSFPSLTFPNHWTLMTGLYPESHGIVGNTFWDPALGEEFYYTDPLRSMQPKWWTSTGAEPLWSTCEKQGIRTAIHMWPGSEAGIDPEPQTIDKYNGKEALLKKVARILSFLDRPSEHDGLAVSASETRPQFIAMYVPNVDADGHKFGPNSTEIRATIESVDLMLGTLLGGIKQRNLTDIVNIVVVSDHGMATTSTSRMVQLDDLLDPAIIEHTDGWPLYGLRPKPEIDIKDLHKKVTAACVGKNVTAYLREEIPARYHFSNSERIAPLWLVPDAGYAIVPRSEFDVSASLQANVAYHPRGLHGYDNQHPLMRAIFIAHGPAFPHRPNSKVEVFQNIEVYNIIADSLGVEPTPNNGTLRLPLKTIGVHTGDKGIVEDLPPHPGSSQTQDDVEVGIEVPVDSTPEQPVPSNSDESIMDKLKSGLHAVGEKANALKEWFKDLLDKYHW